jgi:sec-independent protein translocase protein TatA
MIGSQDVLIGVILLVFLFGAKKLPELAGSLGKSMKEFRRATSEAEAEPAPPPSPAPIDATSRCATCQTPAQQEWRHCPECGMALPTR